MNSRRLLALGGLFVLVALSGCTAFGGGGEISNDTLQKNASYDWNTSVNASYDVSKEPLLSFSSDTYQAVIRVQNRSNISVHRESLFRGKQPVTVKALQFQFTNGTVVNATHANLTGIKKSSRTVMRLPANNGTVGYTANWGGAGGLGSGPRTWRVRTAVEGSHNVTMPAGARTNIPLLSAVSPGSTESTVENNRVRLHWDDLDSGAITVRYFLLRDLYLFSIILLLATLAGVGGVAYYYRQIRSAREKRKEVGLDVEQDDDDDIGNDGPPPGVR
jgi:hypothetical protein